MLKEGTQGPPTQTSEKGAAEAGAAVSEVGCEEAGST